MQVVLPPGTSRCPGSPGLDKPGSRWLPAVLKSTAVRVRSFIPVCRVIVASLSRTVRCNPRGRSEFIACRCGRQGQTDALCKFLLQPTRMSFNENRKACSASKVAIGPVWVSFR